LDDFVYIEEISGTTGGLDKAANLFKDMNDALSTTLLPLLFNGNIDELQAFDADCNNCKYLQRVPFDRIKHPPGIWGMPGICGQFNRPVSAFGPGLFSGHPCFVHRKTGRLSAHVDKPPFHRRFYDGQENQL
jgi:hypothetical protein